jgi:hypothetical protein
MKIQLNSLTKFLLGITATSTLAFATGCAASNSQNGANSRRADGSSTSNNSQSANNTTSGSPAFRAELVTEPGEVRAGQPATLRFTVKDQSGAVVRNLQTVHEKPMHLLIVSSDLAEFYHIHPEPQADGSYRVTHTFPNGGSFRLYADYTPPGATQVVDRIELNVAGAARERQPLVEDRESTKTIESVRVTMTPDRPLRAGDELMLNFSVADARTGRPATDLQPYLGAMAHFVIISEDSTDFLHAHPMTEEEMANARGGEAHSRGGGGHSAGGHGGHAPASGHSAEHGGGGGARANPSRVSAHTTFPRAGLYKVWAQFQRNNQIITVPFVVRVAAGEQRAEAPGHGGGAHGQSAPENSANVPEDALRVTVSRNGYEPSRINVRRGQSVRIAFTRTDAENCGGTVIFPSLNIRRELPVGQTVVVELTPQASGELAFTCGMNMYRGALVVQ